MHARLHPAALFLFAAGCTEQSVGKFNTVPTASITSHSDGDTLQEGVAVTFQGTAGDSNHQATELEAMWRLGSQTVCDYLPPSADGTTECAAIPSAGDASVTLVVRDPEGATAEDTVTFETGESSAPLAEITSPVAGGIYYSDQKITFAGTVSDAEDAPEDLAVFWESDLDGLLADAGSAPDSSGGVQGFGYLSEGEHAVVLGVEDSSGKTGRDSVLVTVGAPNSAPGCAILSPASGGFGAFGDTVALEGTATDADVSPDLLSVEWASDKDGVLGTSVASSSGTVLLSTASLSADVHTITLTVTDEVGASCTDFVSYTVSEPPAISIVSPLDGDVFGLGSSISFSVSVSDAEDSPDELSVRWAMADGTLLGEPVPDSSGTALFYDSSLPAGSHVATATATDSHGLSASALVSFTVDAPPTAPVVSISPDPAVSTDTLVASAAGSTDAEGATVTYSYAWTLGGVSVIGDTLDASYTARGEVWTASVVPSDGLSDGPSGSASIDIGNAPPSVDSVLLSPSSGITADSQLVCAATASDPDGDPLSISYAWSDENGLSLGAGSGLDLSALPVHGSVITCTAVVDDAMGGTATGSASALIGNSAPSVDSLSISPAALYTGDLAVATAAGSDPDGDAVALSYDWLVDGVLVQSGASATLDGALHFDRGQSVWAVATPYDGFSAGASATSNILSVLNTPPTAPALSAAPDPATAGSDDVVCTVDTPSSDADGDALTYSYVWTDGSGSVQQQTPGGGLSDTLPAALATAGTWTCEATPSDGTDYGVSGSASFEVESGPCVQHTDCGTGEYCAYWREDAQYHCSAYCATDSDCGTGETCSKLHGGANARYCEPVPAGTLTSGSACSSDLDCESGSCVLGYCESQCGAQADCGAGETCHLEGSFNPGPLLSTCGTDSASYYDIGQSCMDAAGNWSGSVCESGHCDFHQYDSYWLGYPAYCRPLCSREDDCDRTGMYPEVCDVVATTSSASTIGVPVATTDPAPYDTVTACYEPWGPLGTTPVGTACSANSDCSTNKCLPVMSGSSQTYCTGLCASDPDCPTGMSCGTVALTLGNEWMAYESGYASTWLLSAYSLMRMCVFSD